MANIAYVGIDLAWGEAKQTGIAILSPEGRLKASISVTTTDAILAFISEHRVGDVVAAIDAPLVVVNETGQRPCERELSSLFGRFHAGPHPSNLSRPHFQRLRGAEIAERLGATIDPDVIPGPGVSVAVEVYPHPAMVSLFGLGRVIPYKHKRGRSLDDLRSASLQLMSQMDRVLDPVLRLGESERWGALRETAETSTRKSHLLAIEDELDAVFCAYLAWMWVNDRAGLEVYGDLATGYIVTPPPPSNPTEPDRAAQSTNELADMFARAQPGLAGDDATRLADIAWAYFVSVDGNARPLQ